MRNLIIVGASGFGREVAWLVDRINAKEKTWNLIGFLDDNEELHGKIINNYPVLGGTTDAAKYSECFFVCAIGNARIREMLVEKLSLCNRNIKFATLIDPSVEMSNYVSIGEGTIICAHSILTVNIQIGRHVIINLDCTIGHDCEIRDFSTVYPGANISGCVSIGHTTEIGTGVQIIQEKKIGSSTIIGAGSVVVKDIPQNCTAVGCPAQPVDSAGKI